MNILDLILIMVIAGIVIGAVVHIIAEHKRGNDCSRGCEACRRNCGSRKDGR